MNDRDEKGRLKLPSAAKIPFQRVQTRSNRGSKSNSRQESPEYNKSHRSRRQWGSTESKRGSRSHSFNVSELGNSQDEDKDGYYYDGDENGDHGGRRRKSKSRGSDDDTEKRLGDLSLGNGRKPRRRSMTDGHESTKMPYIPFQRVLNIRKRSTIQEADTGFKIPSFTALRDRRDFRYRYDSQFGADGFTTEYRSRFKQRQKNPKARRKASRNKNESQLNELLLVNDMEKYVSQKESKSDDEIQNDDYKSEKASEHQEGSINGRLSPGGSRHSGTPGGSRHSGSSNGHDKEDRAESTTPSVKFPQIQQSPVSTADSARSVKGSGALPTPLTPNLKSAESSSHSQGHLLLAKLQPVDTSCWVEGKGAGRLSHFFQILKPSEKSQGNKQEPTVNSTTVKCDDAAKRNEENDSKRNDKDFQLPIVHKINDSPQGRSLLSPLAANAAGNFKLRPNKRMTLSRSKSDSALYHVNSRVKTYHHDKNLKPNEILIFSEKATMKSIDKGARPSTSLPRIIVTMPEEHTCRAKGKILGNLKNKNTNKQASIMANVPNLPNIHTHKSVKIHQSYMAETQLEKRLKISRAQGRNNQQTSLEDSRSTPSNVQHITKKRVISTLHKPYKSKSKAKLLQKYNKPTNEKSSRSKSSSPKNHPQSLRVPRHQSTSRTYMQKSLSPPSQKMSKNSKRFSKRKRNASSPQAHHCEVCTPLSKRNEEAINILEMGGYSHSSIRRHVRDIKFQRKNRLGRFAHFLRQQPPTGPKYNNDNNLKGEGILIKHARASTITAPSRSMDGEQEYIQMRNI